MTKDVDPLALLEAEIISYRLSALAYLYGDRDPQVTRQAESYRLWCAA